ncbi:MAG: phosphoglycerate kinase [bacterium]
MAARAYFEGLMTVEDVELKGKRVLIRVDFNVPLKEGRVEDDFRIRSALPTINHVLQKGGKVILMSHLGRPKGKRDEAFSLKPVRDALEKLLGRRIVLAPDCVGKQVQDLVNGISSDEVLLLENTRFHSEETANDPEFARSLAALGDIYVNDAFGAAHRAHASTEGVTHYVKLSVAGFLLEKEVKYLGGLLTNPKPPFIAIIGGDKIAGKIEVLENLILRTEKMLIGGGIANTFLKASGYDVGSSLVEEESLEVAKKIMDSSKSGGAEILLPEDFVIADAIKHGAGKRQIKASEPVPSGWAIGDIGNQTISRFSEIIDEAGTIFWNGPMGVFEVEEFSDGTFAIANAVASASDKGAISVIGGGDSVSAVSKAGVANRISHISTGGGASLEFIGGKVLPGIDALSKKV